MNELLKLIKEHHRTIVQLERQQDELDRARKIREADVLTENDLKTVQNAVRVRQSYLANGNSEQLANDRLQIYLKQHLASKFHLALAYILDNKL